LANLWGKPNKSPRIGKLDLGLELVPHVAGAAEHARALDVLAPLAGRLVPLVSAHDLQGVFEGGVLIFLIGGCVRHLFPQLV